MIAAGIDIGSIMTKGALIDGDRLLAMRINFTGYNAEKAGQKIFEDLLEEAGIAQDDVGNIVATGYGRNQVPFADRVMTEIICHAAGAVFSLPGVRTVIDIGGQDSKVILVDDRGKVANFAMNDKCAAGTGRFLEVMARVLEVSLDDFGGMSQKALAPARISSTCTVFAESEVISLISKGESRENIIAGIHDSVAARVASLAGRVGCVEPVVMTGGVALNGGIVRAMEEKLRVSIQVLETAQLNGAIGAAVMAREKISVR
jgi:(R)-2-hydroxyacyl-CoA dehydratese activating ATPase